MRGHMTAREDYLLALEIKLIQFDKSVHSIMEKQAPKPQSYASRGAKKNNSQKLDGCPVDSRFIVLRLLRRVFRVGCTKNNDVKSHTRCTQFLLGLINTFLH